MREICTSGSEGGAGRKPRSYLYLVTSDAIAQTDRSNFWRTVYSDPSRISYQRSLTNPLQRPYLKIISETKFVLNFAGL